MTKSLTLALATLLAVPLSGCSVMAVADAAVAVTATVVKTVAAAVDLVIPDSEKKKEEKKAAQ